MLFKIDADYPYCLKAMTSNIEVKDLSHLDGMMEDLRDVRREITLRFFEGKEPGPEHIRPLEGAHRALLRIPKTRAGYRLRAEGGVEVHLDLSYEIGELGKDIYFLKHGEEKFFNHLGRMHWNFTEQLSRGIEFFVGTRFRNFITDRDGTVNNYCGRYASSIQSAYNALFLVRFALRRAENSVLLSSGPLGNRGLLDVCTMPQGVFIYAGSKGREYLDRSGKQGRLEVKKEKQKKLDQLNRELKKLLKQPEYSLFSLIGSGLQFKFGETTIARQDVHGSIPKADSSRFLTVVWESVMSVDPDGRYFRVADTGKDVEIILTVDAEARGMPPKEFDKGDGIEFLNRELGLGLDKGPNLICGDTKSDLPMVSVSAGITGSTWAVFVTEDEGLRARVKEICPRSFFVSTPDTLVSLLYILGKRTGL